jgi:hypothetical protein
MPENRVQEARSLLEKALLMVNRARTHLASVEHRAVSEADKIKTKLTFLVKKLRIK